MKSFILHVVNNNKHFTRISQQQSDSLDAICVSRVLGPGLGDSRIHCCWLCNVG